MAIKLRDNQGFSYHSVKGGVLSETEKTLADKLYREAERKLAAINDAKRGLELWYSRGCVANGLLATYPLTSKETDYFWLMLFNCAGLSVPERAKKDGILRNDFWIAAFLENKYQLKTISAIDPSWSTWQEVFRSRSIKDDARVADWLVAYIINNDLKSRDSIRPVLKFISERLKSINTSILAKEELDHKLNEIDTNS